MKYLKRVALWLGLLMSMSLSSYGQSKVLASADVRISLHKALQVNKLQGDLLFGDLVQTGVATRVERTPDKGILFEVNGAPGREITFDFENTSLTNISDNEQLNFIPNLSHTRNNSSYINPTKVEKGSAYKLENTSGVGHLYLWVGGEVLVNSNLSSGDYSGEFLVTVSY